MTAALLGILATSPCRCLRGTKSYLGGGGSSRPWAVRCKIVSLGSRGEPSEIRRISESRLIAGSFLRIGQDEGEIRRRHPLIRRIPTGSLHYPSIRRGRFCRVSYVGPSKRWTCCTLTLPCCAASSGQARQCPRPCHANIATPVDIRVWRLLEPA